jgi:catechol 2,3-dioxygenase-like lactoylglutathione lyase family enzyme
LRAAIAGLSEETGMKYSVTIDVPTLDEALRFYRDGLGLAEIARPVPTYAILKCGGAEIGLMAKAAGTQPAKGSNDVRRYERHWTPVHIDFHVDDFVTFLADAVKVGAVCEQQFAVKGRPPIAFCSDPFGNGFCIIGTNAQSAAPGCTTGD